MNLFLVEQIALRVERDEIGLAITLARDDHPGAVLQRRDVSDRRIADDNGRRICRQFGDLRLIERDAQDVVRRRAGGYGGRNEKTQREDGETETKHDEPLSSDRKFLPKGQHAAHFIPNW